MLKIINQLNESNSANYKLQVLKEHSSNELFQKLLKMTYCTVSYTYGISLKRVRDINEDEHKGQESLENALRTLETQFATRNWSGNLAHEMLEELLLSLSADDAEVLRRVIDRDLKINIGKTQINKVFKNLIVDLPYMRCGVYSDKTSKKISFPAILQEKADGTFRSVVVQGTSVKFFSRSGEESFFPNLASLFGNLSDGVYMGELLVKGITDRADGNGQINSDNPPHDKIYIQLWDYIKLEEWSAGKSDVRYIDRLKELKYELPSDDTFIQLIPTFVVKSIQEALQKTSEFMSEGKEGAILKDCDTPFKDGTSATQLKLKLCIDASVRITGFTEGSKGTKREAYFGAITFENDEGTIKGQTSGFSDAQLKDFNSRREELIGKIIDVQFNDLTKARDNDYYALSHPRFLQIRDDVTKTDTLERVLELKEMAMQLGGKS